MTSLLVSAAVASMLAQAPALQTPPARPAAPAPTAAAAPASVPNPWTHLIPNLGKDLQSFVGPRSAGILLGGGVAALALHHDADRRAHEWVLKQPAGEPGLAKFGNVAGNAPQVVAAIGTWGLGRATGHTRVESTGAIMIRAQLLNGILTQGLKVASQRDRPSGSGRSFPSGHTSATFANAAVIHAEHGLLAALPAYALGGVVGWSRVRTNHHWVSDVVFGAALGTASGFAASHGARAQWQVVPVKTAGGGAIYFVRR